MPGKRCTSSGPGVTVSLGRSPATGRSRGFCSWVSIGTARTVHWSCVPSPGSREHFPNARLDIAGAHPGISVDGVVTHGPLDFSDSRSRSSAERLFESATCFVMPSRFEPFGIVYAEAAAAGVPSIGTDVGGARDAIGPAGGFLVTPGDERMLVEAMLTMCNPDSAAAMGAAALERSSLFTWKSVAERVARPLRLGNEQPSVVRAATGR